MFPSIDQASSRPESRVTSAVLPDVRPHHNQQQFQQEDILLQQQLYQQQQQTLLAPKGVATPRATPRTAWSPVSPEEAGMMVDGEYGDAHKWASHLTWSRVINTNTIPKNSINLQFLEYILVCCTRVRAHAFDVHGY